MAGIDRDGLLVKLAAQLIADVPELPTVEDVSDGSGARMLDLPEIARVLGVEPYVLQRLSATEIDGRWSAHHAMQWAKGYLAQIALERSSAPETTGVYMGSRVA